MQVWIWLTLPGWFLLKCLKDSLTTEKCYTWKDVHERAQQMEDPTDTAINILACYDRSSLPQLEPIMNQLRDSIYDGHVSGRRVELFTKPSSASKTG